MNKNTKQDVRLRGESFQKILSKIVEEDRHVGEQIYLFDDYTVNPLLKKPFRTQYTLAVEVLEGEGTAIVNTVRYHYKAPCLVVLLSGQVIQYIANKRAATRSRVIIFSDQFMNEFYNMALRMNEIYSNLLLNPVIDLDQKGVDTIDLYVRNAIGITSNVENPNRFEALKFLTLSLFYGLLNDVCSKQNQTKTIRAARICSDFMTLVKSNYRKEHGTVYYATKLCITERYLYMSVKSVTGHSAAYWIGFHLLADAKVLLNSTDMSVQQISDELNFNSQSDFGKFFKRLTGVSPLNYRNGKF